MQTKIYVGNLAYAVTPEQLRDFFAPCGAVKDVKIPFDRETRRAKGFAFVEFETQSGAESAITKSGESFLGRAIKINFARDKA